MTMDINDMGGQTEKELLFNNFLIRKVILIDIKTLIFMNSFFTSMCPSQNPIVYFMRSLN